MPMMTGVQNREMLEWQKNKRLHEQKTDFYISEKENDEGMLINLSFL